jgi:hypothetical protein
MCLGNGSRIRESNYTFMNDIGDLRNKGYAIYEQSTFVHGTEQRCLQAGALLRKERPLLTLHSRSSADTNAK